MAGREIDSSVALPPPADMLIPVFQQKKTALLKEGDTYAELLTFVKNAYKLTDDIVHLKRISDDTVVKDGDLIHPQDSFYISALPKNMISPDAGVEYPMSKKSSSEKKRNSRTLRIGRKQKKKLSMKLGRPTPPSEDDSGEEKTNATIAYKNWQKEETNEDMRAFWFSGFDLEEEKHRLCVGDKQDHLVERLMSYVPNLVTRRFLLDRGCVQPPEYQEYPACLLFADISGFTKLSQMLSNEDLVNYINGYFARMIDIIITHGGDIVKFAGDALYAAWPGTAPYKQALLACMCAVEMIEQLSNYDIGIGDFKLQLHCGIGLGLMSGIHLGIEKRREFILAGDVLKQTADTEAAAKPGETYISNETWWAIKKDVVVTGVGKLYRLESVKNPTPLPDLICMPHFADFEESLSPYAPEAVMKYMDQGSQLSAQVRKISVIFVSLDYEYSLDKLEVLQDGLVGAQTILAKWEGTLRQFIIDDKGCVLIAAFGLPPLGHLDDEYRALESTIGIVDSFKKLNIDVKAGVTTGAAFCGAVGSSNRREYAMVGSTVNLAARLMGQCTKSDTYSILCDKTTHDCLENSKSFTFTEEGPFALKNIAEPVKGYSVSATRKHYTLKRHDSFVGRSTELVGRNDEMSACVNLLKGISTVAGDDCLVSEEESEEGESTEEELKPRSVSLDVSFDVSAMQIKRSSKEMEKGISVPLEVGCRGVGIIVEGETGIGKSKFVADLTAKYDKPYNCVTAVCSHMYSATPYFIWIEIVCQTLALENSRKDLLESKALDGPFASSLSKKEIPYLALLNEVFPTRFAGTEESDKLSGRAKAEKLENLVLQILQSVIRPGTIVALEDTHWLDSSSMQVAIRFFQETKNIAIIFVARSVTETNLHLAYQKLIQNPNVLVIKLSGLSVSESSELAKQKLGNSIHETVTQEIYEKSQGNPFFIVEMSTSMVDQGILELKDSQLTFRNEHQRLKLGNTLEGIIISKVDRLTSSQQFVLKLISVLRTQFKADLIHALRDTFRHSEKEKTRVDIDVLITLGYLVETSENVYSFKHSGSQEIIYQMLLHSERKKIHKLVAEYYQKHDAANNRLLVAYHYKQAGEDQQAMGFYRISANECMDLSNYEEAIANLTEAFDLAEKKGNEEIATSLDMAYILFHLGLANYYLGNFQKSEYHLRRALTVLQIDIPLEAKSGLARLKLKKHQKVEYQKDFRQVILPCLLILSTVSYWNCSKFVADVCITKALGIVEPGDSEYLNVLSTAILIKGLSEDVNRYITEVVSLIEKYKKTDRKSFSEQIMYALQKLGLHWCNSPDTWTTAETTFEECISAARDLGDTHCKTETRVFLSELYCLRGEYAKATQICEYSVRTANKLGNSTLEILGLVTLAHIHFSTGKLHEALATLEQVDKISATGMDVSSSLNALGLRALISLYIGNPKDAYGFVCEISDKIYSIRSEPTTFFSYYGFFATIEVFLLILSNPNSWKDVKVAKKSLVKAITHSEHDVQSFAKYFSFAEPRILLWDGYSLLRNTYLTFFFPTDFGSKVQGKQDKAVKSWQAGLAMAEENKMLYDEALISFFLGTAVTLSDNLKYLTKANELFSKMNVNFSHLKFYS